MADNIRNYILVGFDHNDAFEKAVSEYHNHNNIVIIHAYPGESIEEATKEIKGPANVTIMAHGGNDGTFTWNKDENISYSARPEIIAQGRH